MNNLATLIWNQKEIGQIELGRPDMGYYDAKWVSNNSETAAEFRIKAEVLNTKTVMEDWSRGLIATLYFNKESTSQYALILHLRDSDLFIRVIQNETAILLNMDLSPPWQKVSNPEFYRKEIAKSLSFFHRLRWKKYEPIALRTDCDDVLLKIEGGKHEYACVHLTWNKEHSKRFPSTQFYKDWDAVYNDLLLKANKEYSERNS